MAETNEDKPRHPRLLICEGYEDVQFFHSLIEENSLPRFHIVHTGGSRHSSGGKHKFAEAIESFRLKPKTYQSLRDIILVADNDEDPEESFKAVCDQVELVFGNGTAPKKPLERTTTIKPAVSILMMPWTEIKGHLERLCIPAAKDADRAIGACVDYFLAAAGADRWGNECRHAKAWLRSNLAVRAPDPFAGLGQIFNQSKNRGIIPLNHACFENVRTFLKSFDVQKKSA